MTTPRTHLEPRGDALHRGRVLSAGRNGTKARVRLLEWRGRAAVEKDYSSRSLAVRRALGPRLLDREERALSRLAGVDGIPALLARPSRDRLIMQWIEGRPLAELRPGVDRVPAGFFDALERLLTRLHARGVAQGDIGSGDVLVRPDGSPALVDFSVSAVRGGGGEGWLFRAAADQDQRRVAKLRARYSPAEVGERHRRLLHTESRLHRWAKKIRRLTPGRARS